MKKEIIVISLGGSIIIPKTGFDVRFLKSFKELILKLTKKGYKFIIVCGGGQTARSYQKIARELSNLTPAGIDWIGIYATWLNASLLRGLFKERAHLDIVNDPTKKTTWKKPILIAGGWKPGFSTDYDAVKLAELYGVRKVINLSNIAYVFDKNPLDFKDAKKIKQTDWASFRKIVGEKWSPGANLPFDPVASKIAQKLKLILYFVKGTDLVEVEKSITGEKFDGTIIA
ncbi:MAG: UMP kinase [Candidatus Staskawiczbacteria bacterium]|jgi:uridylate kinase